MFYLDYHQTKENNLTNSDTNIFQQFFELIYIFEKK